MKVIGTKRQNIVKTDGGLGATYVAVNDFDAAKIRKLRRKYANVGYALYWRDDTHKLEFIGWGRTCGFMIGTVVERRGDKWVPVVWRNVRPPEVS